MFNQWVSLVCLPASDGIQGSQHRMNFVKNRACHGWLCRTSVAQAGAESKPANSQFTALIKNSAPCYPAASLYTLLGVVPGQDGETASEGRNRQKWEAVQGRSPPAGSHPYPRILLNNCGNLEVDSCGRTAKDRGKGLPLSEATILFLISVPPFILMKNAQCFCCLLFLQWK